MSVTQPELSDSELRVKQGCPASYEELVVEWSPRVEMLGRKYGFRGEDLNDIKGMIFLQFVEGEYLSIYNPTIARFSTFMYNFIQKRLLQQISRKTRDPIARYVPLTSSSNGQENSGEIYEDLYEADVISLESTVESTVVIQEIRDRLARLPQRGKRNLGALFDMLILDLPRSEMANLLDVSEATVCLMIKDLREVSAVKLLRWG